MHGWELDESNEHKSRSSAPLLTSCIAASAAMPPQIRAFDLPPVWVRLHLGAATTPGRGCPLLLAFCRRSSEMLICRALPPEPGARWVRTGAGRPRWAAPAPHLRGHRAPLRARRTQRGSTRYSRCR